MSEKSSFSFDLKKLILSHEKEVEEATLRIKKKSEKIKKRSYENMRRIEQIQKQFNDK